MAGSRRRDDRRVLGTAASRQSASYDQDHRSRAFGPTRTNRARARPLRTLDDLYGPRKRQEAERDETTTPITEGSTCKRNLARLGPIRMLGLGQRVSCTYPARESALPARLRPSQTRAYFRNAPPRRSCPCACHGRPWLTVASTSQLNMRRRPANVGATLERMLDSEFRDGASERQHLWYNGCWLPFFRPRHPQ